MTDRIQEAFARARASGRVAVMPYVTVGFPTLDASLDAVEAMAATGVDVVELGVPFSDPLADGPVIQASGNRALEQGIGIRECITASATLRERGVDIPIVLMGYYNPILTLGIEEFCEAVSAAGVDGLIVPDLPSEEAGPLQSAAFSRGVRFIPLIALTSTEERIASACEIAGGFIYCTAVSGVTGVRDSVSDRVEALVTTARKHTELPMAVGFGISSARNVAEVARFADGAIVGSALINVLEDGPVESAHERAAGFVGELIKGARLQGVS